MRQIDRGIWILSGTVLVCLLTVFALPLLMDAIGPNDLASPIVFSSFGTILGGAHFLAVTLAMLGRPRFPWRFFFALGVVTFMFGVNRLGGRIANESFVENSQLLLMPGIMLAMQTPFVILQMFGKWRIRLQPGDRQENYSIVDLMLFTVLVAVAFACFNAACAVDGRDVHDAIMEAGIFVAVTMGLSMVSWFIYVRMFFHAPTFESAIFRMGVSTLILIPATLAVLSILGAGAGTWQSLGIAVCEIGLATTLTCGFMGVRLAGGELVSDIR